MCATCDLVPLANQAQWFVVNTCGGIGAGWRPMTKAVVMAAIRDCPTIMVEQIKEKFGGLRIYFSNSSDWAEKCAAAAECLSYTICEYCGAPGYSRSGGWIKTLCEACACASPSATSSPSSTASTKEPPVGSSTDGPSPQGT